MWTNKLLSPGNIDRFLVVPDRSHVKGQKLKDVKRASSKKRPIPQLFSKIPAKHTHQEEGETPTSCHSEVVKGVAVNTGLDETIGSSAEPNLVS